MAHNYEFAERLSNLTEPCSSAILVQPFFPAGRNATGVNFQIVELVAKRLGMLRELAHGATMRSL